MSQQEYVILFSAILAGVLIFLILFGVLRLKGDVYTVTEWHDERGVRFQPKINGHPVHLWKNGAATADGYGGTAETMVFFETRGQAIECLRKFKAGEYKERTLTIDL